MELLEHGVFSIESTWEIQLQHTQGVTEMN